MSNLGLIFGFVVAVFIALLIYNGQRTHDTLQRLEAEGFTVDERFNSSPLLLIDRQRKQIALAYPDRRELINFAQIELLEMDIDVMDRDQEPRVLVLKLRNHPTNEFRLDISTTEQTVAWKKQLEQLLAGS